MGERSWPAHRPFLVLKNLVDRGEIDLAPPSDKGTLPPPKRIAEGLTDDEAFTVGMEDVKPLGWSATPLSLPRPLELPRRDDDESEALKALGEFVAGRGEMDPFATGEGVEGAQGLDGRRYLTRLKRGDFSVQEHLDLHGFDRQDAREALVRFLREAQRKGYTCVRIVHGRGTHSECEPSLMKREVIRWLSSRRMRKTVVAFASARWRDGGSGAVYVLLYRSGSRA